MAKFLLKWPILIIKSDKSKNKSVYGLYKYIDEEKRVKKITEKMACHHKIPQKRHFFGFFICYNLKTTIDVKILSSMDYLGSNYPTTKFSSRNTKFSDFDTLAFV